MDPEQQREETILADSWWTTKAKRVEVLRSLSNKWPEPEPHQQHIRKPVLELPEAHAGPIPHEKFRQNLRDAAAGKPVRQVIRRQLLHCEWPRDIYRVWIVAMQHRATQQHMAALWEPIMRALYRCRKNVGDHEVLATLNNVIGRFKLHSLPVSTVLYVLGLKFAARTRGLRTMKTYLKAFRRTGTKMSSNVFRSIIAKFSIGHRGLGEIRNGRWKRADLLQVLTGFDDCKDLPLDQQYHLGVFLERDDWQYLHGWIAALSRCKDHKTVWEEWVLWKQSEARRRPKKLFTCHSLRTTKLRGDYWFLEQMTYAGGFKEAWQILHETDIDFFTLKDRTKHGLLEGLEYAGMSEEHVSALLLQVYDDSMRHIETALGVRWIAADPAISRKGLHVLIGDQEEALDELGKEDWELEQDYGYPHTDAPIVPKQDEVLHMAEEEGLVKP